MSRFLQSRLQSLTPYVPGEQPQGRSYVKLNTNESPFPPSQLAQKAAEEAAARLHLYPDPDCRLLREAMARQLGLRPDQVLPTNGSDEALQFATLAFCGAEHPAVFADITYGFYKVFAALHGVPYREIPLREDFSLRLEDYAPLAGQTLFLANPNAPTGLALSRAEIEAFVAANQDSLIVVDEAYVDFGAESCVPLIDRYDNLLVVQTFSKSRSMAGARLGFVLGCPELIADLDRIRFSTNPYNINSMTMAAGIGALNDQPYTEANLEVIRAQRTRVTDTLRGLGFTVTDSMTNFVFAAHPRIGGKAVYEALRERGVLVRHFGTARLENWNRITIGSETQMDALLSATQSILEAL